MYRLHQPLLLCLFLSSSAAAKPKIHAGFTKDQASLESILVEAGWTMTPERSATYTVGDVYSGATNAPVAFKADCFDAEPRTGAYTSLEVVQAMKAGTRIPLGIARFKAEGFQYKQLKFAEPYVTEMADMHLTVSRGCRQFLEARSDIGDLFVIKAVLSAEVKEQVCKELSGAAGIAGFGASGSGRQECAQGSDGHVAVAYKTLPVAQVLSQKAISPAAAGVGLVKEASSETNFSEASAGLLIGDLIRDQECAEAARAEGARLRVAKLDSAAAELQLQAKEAWAEQVGQLEQCTELKRANRGRCIASVEAWLDVARNMSVRLPAGVEDVETDCGTKRPVFDAQVQDLAAYGVSTAEDLLRRLLAADVIGQPAGQGGSVVITVEAEDPRYDLISVLCPGVALQKTRGRVTLGLSSVGSVGVCTVQAWFGASSSTAVLELEGAGRYGCFRPGESGCRRMGD